MFVRQRPAGRVTHDWMLKDPTALSQHFFSCHGLSNHCWRPEPSDYHVGRPWHLQNLHHPLLLLLHSPAISSGFTILCEIFCVCHRFLIQTIEVVTFHFRGWCMLGGFLLPTFIRLGHEYQDLLNLCGGLHAQTGPLFILSSD